MPTSRIIRPFNTKRAGLTLGVGLWLLAVVAGSWALVRHSAVPGATIRPNATWPVGDSLHRMSGIPTLVMTVHPECPCSRASVAELEVLMTRCRGQLNAYVVFAEPAGLQQDSAARELWKSAAGIDGVTCMVDHNGELSARFGAITSGQVFLYDSSGVLQFSGGITASRGHEGDNDGVDAIEAIINNHEPTTRQTPVFGCSIR